jgi:uncharacterized membrane protein
MRAHRFLRRAAGRKIIAMTMDDHGEPPADDERMLLDLALYPHRSLSPRGFTILMAAIAAVSFCAGLAFYLMGAWPIVGFFGLDVALIYWAFKASYRSGRAYEIIRLTPRELTVERVAPSGQSRRWSFQPYWLRVELEERAGRTSRLTLRSHGREFEVGDFLSSEERDEVADALRHALAQCR